MPAYYTVQSWFDRFFAVEGRSKNKMQWNSKPLIRYFDRQSARTFHPLFAFFRALHCKISALHVYQDTEQELYAA